MEIWRKMQIANVVLALVAVALTVAGCATAAMWSWSITLWVFMFLVPMPVIERNKKDNQRGNHHPLTPDFTSLCLIILCY